MNIETLISHWDRMKLIDNILDLNTDGAAIDGRIEIAKEGKGDFERHE